MVLAQFSLSTGDVTDIIQTIAVVVSLVKRRDGAKTESYFRSLDQGVQRPGRSLRY